MLKLIYTIFLGIMLALFVGVGISVFYEAPKAPVTPAELQQVWEGKNGPSEWTAQQRQLDLDFQKQQRDFEVKNQNYSRNVSVVALGFAVLMLGAGLLLSSHISILADGATLGGVFTLIYSLIRGLASENNVYRFAVVSVALLIAIILGYIRFIRPGDQVSAGAKAIQ